MSIYERGLQELLLGKNSVCLGGKGPGISQADASFLQLCGGPFLQSFAVIETIYSSASISPCKSGYKYGSGHTQQNLRGAEEQLKFSTSGFTKDGLLHIPKEK